MNLCLQIADEMKPNRLAILSLTYLARFLPTWPLTPTPDIVDIAFRDPNVRNEVCKCYYPFSPKMCI